MCQSNNVIAFAGMIIRFFGLRSVVKGQVLFTTLSYGQAPYACAVAAQWQCLPSCVACSICESASYITSLLGYIPTTCVSG